MFFFSKIIGKDMKRHPEVKKKSWFQIVSSGFLYVLYDSCTEVWLMWSTFLAVLNFHINSGNLDLCQVRLNLAAALLRLDDSMEDVRVLKGIWWKWRVGRLLQQNFYPKPLSLEAKTSCCFCLWVLQDVDVQESKVIKLCNEVVALDSSNTKATSGGVGEVWFQLR